MSGDASFEEGAERPLNLGAMDADDLGVISALVQDAVLPITEISWQPAARRLALLVNRFRWEDGGRERHGPERVRALLVVDNVIRVASQGIDRKDRGLVLSLLSVSFEPGEDEAGQVLLTLAGDGAIRLEVEALEVTLKDVTRPYKAPSGHVPGHED
ncbi:DUF2948 family protein [Seohaeicola zhoushanensis]|uniref:DUF2948 domain-containing protein n=1 Tax=Seohaeicola zhoushanensis TaxID=1569283 RepID=A0A8J3M8B0_9RHOB|nr:DUF2948 family protein [Seohaeicola zhoushanensis]GHF41151.1 hypothetical protein GCM10017056_10950 [Seohaeicola zhoushanensis]